MLIVSPMFAHRNQTELAVTRITGYGPQPPPHPHPNLQKQVLLAGSERRNPTPAESAAYRRRFRRVFGSLLKRPAGSAHTNPHPVGDLLP